MAQLPFPTSEYMSSPLPTMAGFLWPVPPATTQTKDESTPSSFSPSTDTSRLYGLSSPARARAAKPGQEEGKM